MTANEILLSINEPQDPTPSDLTAKLILVGVGSGIFATLLSLWYDDPTVFFPAWAVLGSIGAAYVWSEQSS